MKSLKRKLFIFTLMLCFAFSSPVSALAAPVQTQAVYDLAKGGTQTFLLKDENGNVGQVIIEEIQNNSKVADNTYKVTYEFPAVWTAGFYVKISNNKIIDAHSPFHDVAMGSISGTNLTRNSTSKATYSFIHKLLLINYDTGVIVTISDSQLIVKKR